MALPLKPPLLPQLARPKKELPTGDGWAYEPKFDGFRCIAFADGDERVRLQSRTGRDLTRYFPELRFPAGRRLVLDGEIIVLDGDGNQDFDLLGQRIHPAKSRVDMLAAQTPARFVAFDLLAEDDEVLLELPQAERRARLAEVVDDSIDLAPMASTAGEAEQWLRSAEGVIAKQTAARYKPGERTGMVKIKRVRTIDAVVRGWRPGKEEGTVGSLILGLYNPDGDLVEVGHTSGFKAKEKRGLVATLKPYETGERGTAEPSRWAGDRDLQWVALRPELVVEIAFDHTSNGRIRHGAKILRWREDKPPEACTIDQLDQ